MTIVYLNEVAMRVVRSAITYQETVALLRRDGTWENGSALSEYDAAWVAWNLMTDCERVEFIVR